MKDTKYKAAWLYSRVACPIDSEVELKLQENNLLQYANENGYIVVGKTAVQASGLHYDRLVIKNLLDNALRFQYLIIRDFSRLGRDTIKTVTLIDLLHSKGIEIISTIEETYSTYAFSNSIVPFLKNLKQ